MKHSSRNDKFRKLFASFVFLAGFFFAAAPASAQSGSGSIDFTPPMIPITFSLNFNGTISASVSKEIVTPLGTFAIGGSISQVPANPEHTCFIVRRKEKESPYCIGTRGAIRLTTRGTSVVDISHYPGRANVFLVDVVKERGQFSVEFIPDKTTGDVARVRIDASTHLAVKKNGDVQIDMWSDLIIPHRRFQKAAIFNTGCQTCAIVVLRSIDAAGTRNYHGWFLGPTNILEGNWFLHALEVNRPGSTLRPKRVFEAAGVWGNKKYIYEEGSIFDGAGIVPRGSISRISRGSTDTVATLFLSESHKRQWGVSQEDLYFGNAIEMSRFIEYYQAHFGS